MIFNKYFSYSNAVLIILAAVFWVTAFSGKPAWAAGQLLKVKTIEQTGRDFILDTLQWDKDRIELKVIYEGKDIIVPRGNMLLHCKLPGGKKRIGRIQFMCFVRVNGIIKKRLRLFAKVNLGYDIFRLTRSLKRGHIIQPQDVELVRLKSDRVIRNLVSDNREIIGYRLIRNLEKGETILTHMLRRVPLVKNGDRILIIAQKGALRVTAPGVVKENGFKNDTVRVENIHSRKIVFGTVIDSRTIHINF